MSAVNIDSLDIRPEELREGVLYYTRNLSLFGIGVNRPVGHHQVSTLTQSIKQSGFLMGAHLIVTQQGRTLIVADGQHRLEAAKNAKSGVYFMVDNQWTPSVVVKMNATQKGWSMEDYLTYYRMHSESKRQRDEYQHLYDFMAEFGLTITTALQLATGEQGPGVSQAFKDGKFVFSHPGFARKVAAATRDFTPYFDGYNHRSFVNALAKMFQHQDYDHTRMQARLEYAGSKMHRCTNADDYLALLEFIYNYRTHADNRIAVTR